MKNVEKMSPDEVIDELLLWRSCFKDAPDNFDARLLKRSAEIIGILIDKLAESDMIYEVRNERVRVEEMVNEQRNKQ